MRGRLRTVWRALTVAMGLLGVATLVAVLLGRVTIDPTMLAVVVAAGTAGAAADRDGACREWLSVGDR